MNARANTKMKSRSRVLMIAESISFNHISKLVRAAQIIQSEYPESEIIFGCSPDKRHLIEKMGFQCVDILVQDPVKLYGRVKKLQPMYTYSELKAYLENDVATLQAIKPDVVFFDWRLTLPIAAKIVGVKTVALTSCLWSPLFDGAKSVPFQIADRLPIPRVFQNWIYQSFLGKLVEKFIFWRQTAPLRRLSREFNQKPLKSFQDYASSGDVCLIADDESLIPVKENKSISTFVIGPLLWSNSDVLPDELKLLKQDGKTIYFSMGTSVFPEKSVNTILVSLLGAGYRVILQKGSANIPNLPKHPNLFVYNFLPNFEVTELSDLIISHGGISTTYEALENGNPIIGIPSIPDQQWHMDALEALNLGKKISPNRITETSVLNAVETLLSRPKEKREAMRAHLRQLNSRKRLLDAIGELMNQSQRSEDQFNEK